MTGRRRVWGEDAMTKKKISLSIRRIKILISLSVILCLFTFFRINKSPAIPLLRKHQHQHPAVFDGPPKIAFLFLVRKDLPLDFVWDSFFRNAEASKFSIHIHSSQPGFLFHQSTTKSAFFYGRQLTKPVRVVWGESSMIEAERMLIAQALKDPANQRFLLLSDSCVPLYNFTYIYNYMMLSPRSFVDSFLDVKEGRFNPKMSHVIPKEKWRKGSQWITVVREHAEVIVDDDVILPVFKKHCKRRPPIDPKKGRKNIQLQMQHNCIPDEHYVQTLLAMCELESELERRTLTYTSWNQSTNHPEKTAWHPVTFSYVTAGPQQIKAIKEEDEWLGRSFIDLFEFNVRRRARKNWKTTNSEIRVANQHMDINHVYYESEYRTEWCKTNSTLVSCFLFARKFSKAAAMRLLSQSFDAAALLH